MCTFLNKLPDRNKVSSVYGTKRQRIFLPIKPTTDPKAVYRFRILAYKSSKTDREYPFIERFTHTKWGRNENGKPIMESQVICPSTAYVKSISHKDCPICKLSNANFKAYNESGKRDRESLRRGRENARKFEAMIPVYVVNDPNNASNNNQLRVIMLDKTKKVPFRNPITKQIELVPAYECLEKLINASSEHWCNSENAVDLCIRMERVKKVYNEGQPNELHTEENEYKLMTFSTKPYTIESITQDLIDGFEFDDQYYVSSTKEELMDYYNRYCRVRMDDVEILDEEEIPVPPKPVTKPAPKKSALIAPPPIEDEVDDLDALTDVVSSVEEEPAPAKKAPHKLPPKPEKAEENIKKDDSDPLADLDDLDLDSLLDDKDMDFDGI